MVSTETRADNNRNTINDPKVFLSDDKVFLSLTMRGDHERIWFNFIEGWDITKLNDAEEVAFCPSCGIRKQCPPPRRGHMWHLLCTVSLTSWFLFLLSRMKRMGLPPLRCQGILGLAHPSYRWRQAQRHPEEDRPFLAINASKILWQEPQKLPALPMRHPPGWPPNRTFIFS